MKRRRKLRSGGRKGRYGHSMRGMLRRRNFPMTLTKREARKYAGTGAGEGYTTFRKRLAAKRKRGYSLYLRRMGFGRYKGLSKKARHIGRPVGSGKKRKTHSKARARRRASRRAGRRGRHLSAAHKRALMRGLRRWQRKHGRKTHSKARARRRAAKRASRRRGHRPSRKAIAAMRRGLRRYLRKKRAARLKRIRALRKARKVRGRKLYGRRPLIRRAARRVKRYRPGVRISAIRRMISRDLRHKAHRRGRGRSYKVLARDAVFGIDFHRALRGQHIRLKNMRQGKWIRRMGRHPSHLRRRLPRRVVRGWKEFAGYRPNLVASFRGSPVRGTFNGVLIQKLAGTLSRGGGSATITPPRGKELMFMWSNGGRTFEVVGGPAAITSLAKSMARAGCPIRLRRIDYAAARYPVAANARRTSTTRMDILYYHNFTHEVYLSWNGKFGSKARFPIITRGTRGASMVNRSGLIL